MTTDKQAEIAAYRAHPGINATTIKAGRTSMLHARHAYRRGDIEPTPAMELGTAVHAMLASIMGFGAEAVVRYEGRRAGKEWEAFAIANADKIILPAAAHDTASAMFQAANVPLCDLIRIGGAGEFEKPIYWERDGVKCKALPDLIQEKQIVDFKTTTTIDPRTIERNSYSMGWHLQMGWYMDAHATLYPNAGRPTVWILAIESKPPHDVVLYRMDDDALDRGRNEAREIAARFAACLAANSFPGIQSGGMPLALALPTWAETDTVDMTELE